jgi:hypothetical protein
VGKKGLVQDLSLGKLEFLTKSGALRMATVSLSVSTVKPLGVSEACA